MIQIRWRLKISHENQIIDGIFVVVLGLTDYRPFQHISGWCLLVTEGIITTL